MSVVPYILNELLDDYYDPVSRLYDQNFGSSLFGSDLRRVPSVTGLTTPFLSGYLRPLRAIQPQDSGVSSIVNEKDNFKVILND